MSLGNEAASNRLAWTLIYTLRSVAAKFNLACWAERVPSSLNPAGNHSRSAPSPIKLSGGASSSSLRQYFVSAISCGRCGVTVGALRPLDPSKPSKVSQNEAAMD